MVATLPAGSLVFCPRCKALRYFIDLSAGAILYRCSGCEWQFTFTAVAPTGTSNAAITAPSGSTFAISVASGGASFTGGMLLLYDTGVNAEVLRVSATGSATVIPVGSGTATPGEVQSGFAKTHLTAATFGQLLVSPSFSAVGEQAVPAAPGWGF
jgi:hypothetical protein